MDQTTRGRLCAVLNAPHPFNDNWRGLADKMGYNRYVAALQGTPNPADALLELWLADGPHRAQGELCSLLRAIHRADLAELVSPGAAASASASMVRR